MLATTLVTIFILVLIITNKELVTLLLSIGLSAFLVLLAAMFFIILPLIFFISLMSKTF